ncbi:MAG: 6-carboxytetrahydropterin synthase [Thermoanaerobaculales bacterium]|jgi:6-pyruvoyltetrahydropterin/6-carboxytetrahydropterin synthase|nr:6-carboxytetrahydropterin synthase [Thermoanaerobaculales bacterium]
MGARWVIHSRASFEARHALTVYQGRPEEAHNHRWEVAVRVGTDELNDEGFALDFHEVHALLEDEIAPLRNSDLNLHPAIGTPTPSAERVAEILAGHLQPKVHAMGGRLLSVSVWEGPDNRVDLCLE